MNFKHSVVTNDLLVKIVHTVLDFNHHIIKQLNFVSNIDFSQENKKEEFCVLLQEFSLFL